MKKRTNKGQALIEFVFILPIFLFMMLAMFDIGKIFYFKSELTNYLEDVISMYETQMSKKDIEKKIQGQDQKIDLVFEKDGKYTNIELTKDIEIITPGLNLIFENPYQIKVKRVVLS